VTLSLLQIVTMTLNKIFTLNLLFLFLSFNARADYWTQKSDFGGAARHAAAGFFLNGKGYIGTGTAFFPTYKDFWAWDPSTDVWTQKANFGGAARSGAVGFAIGNLGYIATGAGNSFYDDLWAYNPTTNTWTQKADFGGGDRHFAVAFELNGMGYLGTGDNNGGKKDFWQYNPSTNTWTQKANFGGTPRSSAVGFSLNGKGYLGIGYGNTYLSDFWEYDPATNIWTQKANFGGGPRSDAGAFAVCGKGYIVGGVASSLDQNDVWEYDPVLNTWTQKADLTGDPRDETVAFSDGTYGYIGTGLFFDYPPPPGELVELNDFWQYTPDGCAILPIGLTRFTAITQGPKIKLQWTTESEINNNYFTVEKSLDGLHFVTLCTVKGVGNSSSPLDYEAEDENPFTGLNYYRLKQTDFDGSYAYSNVVSCIAKGNGMMSVQRVDPNPVQSFATITLDISDDEDVSFQLFNTQGQSVYDKSFFVQKGVQHIDLDFSGLKNGIYLLRIHCEYGSYSQKLIKFN